jgi:hypothetical protein
VNEGLKIGSKKENSLEILWAKKKKKKEMKRTSFLLDYIAYNQGAEDSFLQNVSQ